jgi:predicted ATP-dependent endonuclease of OLD family
MYLSKLTISGFRQFGQGDAAAELTFQPGVTALIGKNDSGKTAIIDAVRYALRRCCMEHEEVGTRPTRDGFQAVRSNLGRPSSVIRLRIRTLILASVF